eukprot:14024843-Ditylum_brightwellii.AAC.1
MHNQKEYLVSNLNLLLGSLTKNSATVDKNCIAIKDIQFKFEDKVNGPHNKHQKHENMEVEIAEVMENVDAFCHSRDTHAPDPEGVGGI